MNTTSDLSKKKIHYAFRSMNCIAHKIYGWFISRFAEPEIGKGKYIIIFPDSPAADDNFIGGNFALQDLISDLNQLKY